MPAKSKAQQRLMGQAYAYKTGQTLQAPAAVRALAASMSLNDLKDFAETKHDKLPERVKKKASEEDRINNADLSYPVLTRQDGDRRQLLDGSHRMEKAIRTGEALNERLVPEDIILQAIAAEEVDGKQYTPVDGNMIDIELLWELTKDLEQTPLDRLAIARHTKQAEVELINNPESQAHGQEVDTSPSEAKKESENYSKAHVWLDGLNISIENPTGSLRCGVAPDGTKWESEMFADYGYIKGSLGYDKDHVDLFIAPGYKGGAGVVYVVNQVDPATGAFDEHKCVIGVDSAEAAKALYLKNYDKGWKGCESVVARSIEDFKVWVYSKEPLKGSLEPYHGWVGVDLDATLAKYNGWKGKLSIGEPIPKMVRRVKNWLAAGQEVRIFTARAHDISNVARRNIEKWCLTHIGQTLDVTCVKDPQMVSIWDDRAVSIRANTGNVMKAASYRQLGKTWTHRAKEEYWDLQECLTAKQAATIDVKGVSDYKTYTSYENDVELGHVRTMLHSYNPGGMDEHSIYHLHVEPEARGKGVAKKLLNAVIADWGDGIIHLEVGAFEMENGSVIRQHDDTKDERLRKLYRSVGFEDCTLGMARMVRPANVVKAAAISQAYLREMAKKYDPAIHNPPPGTEDDRIKDAVGPAVGSGTARGDRGYITLGEYKLQPKVAAAAGPVPRTGPEAIQAALARLDPAAIRAKAMEDVKVKSRRQKAVKRLNLLRGLERNGVTPDELMVTRVPVIPPAFRPFSMQGTTFIPGDANELYRDLISMRDAYDDESGAVGPEASAETFSKLRGAVRAVYGYGDPVEPKTLERGVSGFMKHIVGRGSSKHSFFQRKMVSKPQDNVGMSVITVDPDLSMDEIGIPASMAWDIYKPYIQRRLVRKGYTAANAVREIRDRTDAARRELDFEVLERPVNYTRAPSWHKWNAVAGRPKIIEGDAIAISPLVTTGSNADFDGDQMAVHVPSLPESVKESYERLLPSKMLLSNRDNTRVVNAPKHEQVLGLHNAQVRPARTTHQFKSKDEALQAVRSGSIPMSDEVEFPGMVPA